MSYRRIFVEKKPSFRVEAESLREEFNENLSLDITSLRLINVYDLNGFSSELLEKSRYMVFGEKVTDLVTDSIELEGKKYIAVEFIPGQFDQRASSAVDCVHLIDPSSQIEIKSSRLLIFDDNVTEETLTKIKSYYINKVESREKDLSKLSFNDRADVKPLQSLDGFINMDRSKYATFCKKWGLAMNEDDLHMVVEYFSKEKRNPTEIELRILDTYWSDHCRHTTFSSLLEDIIVEESFISEEIESQLTASIAIRRELGREQKPFTLMELATLGARYLRKKGYLNDMEVSEENNACSIFVDVDVDSKNEKWLLQFKNETHNHPTEIEPFGGASTCLGGAIRDPLSGRSYVYQAMRITGAGDICKPVPETMRGKLPQCVISRKAASGYSSYGNQIGLATTFVREIFHDGYTAKRMEIGAVVGAVRADRVRRETPVAGDVILLLGGRTGRDGIGGATGSSKEHTEDSIETCGSEVQKGNAPEERKLQRLFRRPEVSSLIKKSNDFGAGGVSVAIGELSDGLDIYLDRVPVKYRGLNPMELAISESQERMAVVIESKDRELFEQYCKRDNVEVTYVADVTNKGRMRLFFKGELVADLSREFIDCAGASHYARATVGAVENRNPFENSYEGASIREKMENMLRNRNISSQQGLVEMFDPTIGRSTVLMPYGGRRQASRTQVSAQKLPVDGYTDTASVMAYGYNPFLASWSPYHAAAYSVVEACAKVVASGAPWSTMRFSYQEYFERMTHDPKSWGKPLASLLGALKMQRELMLPSIGGKDSMSGTFENISVPPTLVAFGITTHKASKLISTEFKKAGNFIYLMEHKALKNYMPDTDALKSMWDYIFLKIQSKDIVSAFALEFGGVAEALFQMMIGNGLGCNVECSLDTLFNLGYGSILVESKTELNVPYAKLLGHVTDSRVLINSEELQLFELEKIYKSRYAKVYPQTTPAKFPSALPEFSTKLFQGSSVVYKGERIENPVVYIPVFPGTNCDYDSAKAFRKAGAEVRVGIFRNLTPEDVQQSILEMKQNIDQCQILMFAGGFSVGDEPDGSGKFIASVINNQEIARAIEALVKRGGLILGICNGFQALIKSGLLPYGKPGMVNSESPTLFRNDINRHVSRMATTRLCTNRSPWLQGMELGGSYSVALSHGEGKFVISEKMASELFENGQVAFQYVSPSSNPTMDPEYNPNGSYYAIEGIIDSTGQILGKMGHSERYEENLFKNIQGNLDEPLFQNAVKYFRKETR
ncbi:MAG: phosphoribosylformylglycinamidine synthase [Alistipes sp.]|nr:phosphoribosylformylglycinamidine synthase [Candidatus Alistipes equi]